MPKKVAAPVHNQRYRTKEEAEFVRSLIARGWQWLGRTGMNHGRLLWPPTGFVLIAPSTGPKHYFDEANRRAKRQEVAADAGAVSG